MKYAVIIISAIMSVMLSLYSPHEEKAGAAIGVSSETEQIYKGEIEHFFTHCLIAHPEIAFAEGNYMGKHYDADCLTAKEFNRILEQMYSNGYALIDVGEVYEVQGGKAVKRSFGFPTDKKPMILSFDDVVYDSKKAGKGMADRLIIEGDRVRAYTDGLDRAHDNEFVPILENFISAHPDFSVRGARGIICLTGFDGILGYRAAEKDKAKVVADKLKADGWKFACHSYAHRHMKKVDGALMQDEMRKWAAEVEPLIGKTDLYVYPYGEWAFDCPAHSALISSGFKFFFGVSNKPFFS